jgi:hypothetical protein
VASFTATALQLTPEGERALVDAQLREMSLDLRYITFTLAADRYSMAVAGGHQPSLVAVFEAAVLDLESIYGKEGEAMP